MNRFFVYTQSQYFPFEGYHRRHGLWISSVTPTSLPPASCRTHTTWKRRRKCPVPENLKQLLIYVPFWVHFPIAGTSRATPTLQLILRLRCRMREMLVHRENLGPYIWCASCIVGDLLSGFLDWVTFSVYWIAEDILSVAP